jgi:DNA-binding CsgD family transcriptional regulator
MCKATRSLQPGSGSIGGLSYVDGLLRRRGPDEGSDLDLGGRVGWLSPYYLTNWVEGAPVPVAGVVGRDREMAAVAAFLDAVPSGPCGLVLEGVAGIGKTTVWRAGAAGAAGRSYIVLSCRPAESEATLSFAALGDLLDGVLDRVLPRLPPPQRRALEVALLLTDPVGRLPEPRAVAVAFLAVIRHLSASRPVVLAVDDLQWLDDPSARVVEFALRRLGGEQVGLLASARDPGQGGPAPTASTGLPAERLTRLRVGPLTLGAFQSAVRATAGPGMSRLTIRRLFDASAGNPFYGLELARVLQRAGAEPSPEDPLPVPADLTGVLSARLAALSAGARDALLVASCLRSPTTMMLEQASGPAALAALQTATSQGVAEVEGPRVRFTHPLFASAIYSGASAGRRREVHRRLGEIAPNLEERARHLALSSDGPDEYVAAVLGQAAHAAAARGAPDVAAELAELAAALTPPDRLAARWRRRADAGGYLFRAGDTARARRHLEALVGEMPAGRDRAEALLVLATILYWDEGEAAAVSMLGQALGEAAASRVLQARIHIEIAKMSFSDLPYGARHAEAGLALARQVDDPGLTGEALVRKLYLDLWTGRGLAVELGEQALKLEREARPARVWDRAPMALAVCLKHSDRFDEARHWFEQALRAAREEGDESSLPDLLAHMSDLECWAGNWPAAERYAAESWEAGQQVEHRAWRSIACYVRALIDAHLGRVDAARAEAEEGLSVATTAQEDWEAMLVSGALGFAELTAGRLEQAEASLSRAANLSDRIGLAEPAAWRFHANHIEAVIGLGDLDRAERLLGRFEGRGRATGRAWTLATAARCRGLLLAARGDVEGAVQALEDALGHHQDLAMPFELGRTLLVMGQVQRRAKRKRAAKEHLGRAVEIFESLPSPPWAGRASAELSRIGLRPPAPLELTATEERVAALAAAGHTNRQVAQALFVSTRTVEANLTRVYRKLGISSRAELSAAIARTPPPHAAP